MENIKLVPKEEIGAVPSSHGFEFETKVTLFTALTAALTFDDFEINTNVKNFEPLDDIFLKGYKNGEETSYLVQLKHVAKSARLKDISFINENDLDNKFQKKPKFDLIRYNNKYIDLSKKLNTDNINFIFYTNYEMDVNSTLFLKNGNLDDMLINSLNTSARQESFLLNKNSDKLKLLNEHFISNSYFLTNQENVDNIGNSILNLLTKFQISENLSELIIGNLFHYFDTICSETQNKPVITKSLTLKLIYFSCLYCRNITIFKLPSIDSHSVYSPHLWDYLKKNKVIIKHEHVDSIKNMIFNHYVLIQKNDPVYMNILFKHQKFGLKQIVKRYFVQCCCGFLPFLIESQYHQEIVDIVNTFKNVQVIFIDKNSDKYIESKFSGVSFEFCEEVFKIKIRPLNRNECLIEDLFENKDELKLMLNNVNVSDFLEINENIQLKDKKEGILLDRFVYRPEIEGNSLNDLIKDDVVVIISSKNYSKIDLIGNFCLKISKDLINYVDETNVINSNSKIIVLNDDNYNKFNINKIKNKYKSKNVHFLDLYLTLFPHWVNTFGSIKNIKFKEINNYRYDKLQSIPQLYKCNELIVFSGIPGIGKSVAMNQLATFYPPNVYVLLIKLSEKQVILNKLTDNLNCLQILKLLFIETNTFYSNIFEQKFKQKDLCVILDGYDEVAPKFIKITNELIKCILRENIQVVLTTRTVLQNEIEKEFSTKSLILKPFNLEQQTQYLEQYFSQNSKLDEYDIKNICTDIVNKTIKDLIGDVEFNSVPLHLKIICDLLLDLFKQNNFNVVDIQIDKLKLYETFIAKKLEVFTDKTKELNFNEGEIIKYHQSFALKEIFPHFIDSTVQENINVFSQRIANGSEKTGFLVDDVNEIFIHRTIAEYFTASWLVDNCENNNSCIKLIINEIFEKEYYFVHSCFNSLLYNKTSVWDKIFFNKFNEITSKEIGQKYFLNRNILHLLVLTFDNNIISNVISSSLEEFLKNNIHEIKNFKSHKDYFQLTPFDYLEKMMIEGNELQVAIKVLKNNFYFHFKQNFTFLEFLNCKNIDVSNSNLKFKNGFDLLLFTFDEVNSNKFNFIFLWENYDRTNNVRLLEDYKIGFEWLLERGITHDELHYKAVDINSIQLTTFLLENYDVNHSFMNIYYNPLSYDFSSNLIDYIKLFFENERIIKNNTPVINRIRNHFIKYILVNNLFINNSGSSQLTLLNQLREFPELINIYRDFIIKEKNNKSGNTVIHLIILSKNDKNFTQNTFYNKNLLNLLKYVITIENNINSINDKDETPLHLAIKNNDLETIKILIKYKVDINYLGMWQKPYLHCSIKINNLEIMKLLLEHEANIEIEDHFGETPLICAIQDKNLNAAKILLENKANIEATNYVDDTPLIFAIRSKNLELIKLLLNFGVKINTTNDHESSPLSIAAELNIETKIIKLLIDKDTDIENVDLDENTPLLCAILAKNLETLKLLIQCGAKINVQNYELKSPLHIAVEKNSLEIVKVLMENNAKLDVIDKKGKTPLSLALETKSKEIIQLLKASGK